MLFIIMLIFYYWYSIKILENLDMPLIPLKIIRKEAIPTIKPITLLGILKKLVKI